MNSVRIHNSLTVNLRLIMVHLDTEEVVVKDAAANSTTSIGQMKEGNYAVIALEQGTTLMVSGGIAAIIFPNTLVGILAEISSGIDSGNDI